MSFSFNGLIHEFPFQIDCFNNNAEAYFLTHSHSDHLTGLLNKSFTGYVYCTKITRDILATDDRFSEVIKYFKVKEYNTPFYIDTFIDGRVTVTLINSYHCPGSTMYLMESEYTSILFTGDLRAESWWLNTLEKNKYLFPYLTGLKRLDNIYLDTTFSYRGEPYIDIMPNTDGIVALIEFLKLYPPDIEFLFIDAVSGSEEVWFNVVEYFNGLLIPDEKIRKRLEVIDEKINRSDETGRKFYVGKHENNGKRVWIKHCIDFNIVDYITNCIPKKTKDYDVLEMFDNYLLVRHDKQEWIYYNEELLPRNILLMFSRHSSYTESKQLVEMFQPRTVWPCTETQKSWLNGFSIAHAFGGDNHRYDLEMTKLYGAPLIPDRPVAVIDRWSFAQCLQEIEFLKQYNGENVKDHPFKGTMKFEDHQKWKRDFKLQGVITGRGEFKYNEIINLHQQLTNQYSTDENIQDHDYEIDSESEPEQLPSIIDSSFLEQSFDEIYSSQVSTTRIDSIVNNLNKDPRNWFMYKFNTH
ncbi:unnamed protein product [Candida verbasci]|uniref:DNA repair metallo-beta-lactamase domain-containing protein n=1 Tax=Candida verbasci TaxID=1227364 RepID=A0A9W4TY51_9ASCO|nr:unnamed protein product [Candida verbasci]